MRAYVPATVPLLARWRSAEAIDAELVFAVTPGLREWYATDDTEELEYAALTEAARASLLLLAADPAAPRRRVVLAVDAPGAEPGPDLGRAGVRVAGPLALEAVAAVHADDGAAEPAVRAAAAAIDGAAAGDSDAEQTVAEADEHELLWYGNQEISDLLAQS